MLIFVCAGEPSGDLHGANLIRHLRRLNPDVECVGFGGERMEEAGCRLLYPLCRLAVMWLFRVLAHAPVFLDLLSQADRFFRHQRPDAVVLIDYPGFNWWLARRAHFHGIPVFYFVPPQLWGWAGWRVKKMRRWVDHVLCPLPFEEEWYRKRGIDVHYVGHPYFDELARQKLDASWIAEQRATSPTIVGLLPGSRNQEVERNLPTLIGAAKRIHAARPQTRFLAACFKPSHRQYVEDHVRQSRLPISAVTGRTPEIIHLSTACIAVSGSVGLELLHHGKPTVVVYRVSWVDLRVAGWFKTSQYISLVNLLAGKEIFPEFLSNRCEAEAVSRHVLDWLSDRGLYELICADMSDLRQRVAKPGACEHAAEYILRELGSPPLVRCA